MNSDATVDGTTPEPSRLKGRPPLFDSDRVEEQVADLFWARGYDGVSISDITSATGLSKSSLYNSFGGKDDLFRKALTRYHNSTVQAGADWLAADDGSDPLEKLDQLLRGPADDVHGRDDTRGCFLCNTSADGQVSGREGRAPDIDTLVGEGFAKLEAGMIALFTRHAPSADASTIRDAARLSLTTYVGLRIRSRVKPTRAEFDSVRTLLVDAVRRLLESD